MNTEQVIAYAQIFLGILFENMNEGIDWDIYDETYDNITFHEICNQQFDGNVDLCVDMFFRRTAAQKDYLFHHWLSFYNYIPEYEDNVRDNFLLDTFYQYIKNCSLDELKEILGLNFMLK